MPLLLLRAEKYISGAGQDAHPPYGHMQNTAFPRCSRKPFIGATLLTPAVTGGFLGGRGCVQVGAEGWIVPLQYK